MKRPASLIGPIHEVTRDCGVAEIQTRFESIKVIMPATRRVATADQQLGLAPTVEPAII